MSSRCLGELVQELVATQLLHRQANNLSFFPGVCTQVCLLSLRCAIDWMNNEPPRLVHAASYDMGRQPALFDLTTLAESKLCDSWLCWPNHICRVPVEAQFPRGKIFKAQTWKHRGRLRNTNGKVVWGRGWGKIKGSKASNRATGLSLFCLGTWRPTSEMGIT